MKKILSLVLLLCVISAFAAPPKYVFLFFGDGMSFPQRLVTEEYMKTVLGKQPIFNHFPVNAATRTSCADKFVTDSAASGTAIACGEKTNYMSIGVGVDGVTPLESVAYVAKKRGMKVGIMTSVTINHATPSA
ncbi:MAG: alkaline phosphatase, partial [Victivallales bacterium]|nr:alkaline phosphatase [Victivallales bacterium]